MKQIPGTGNWILSYHISDGAATIDWAVTCDAEAILPEELDGFPVRGLSEYSLSRRRTLERAGDHKVPPGSELAEITGFHGSHSALTEDLEWDNLGIRSLTLPEGLTRVGSYALMGCRNLRKLTLHDRQIQWGTAPLMNCLISEISLYQAAEDSGNLAFLCQEMSQELDVTIHLQKTGSQTAQLLFPEFLEIWDENTPARQADYTTQGIGYAYHHVFRDHILNYRDYDKLWLTFCGRGDVEREALMRLAWYRVRYPEGLADEFRLEYLAFLQKDFRSLLLHLIDCGTAEDLNVLTQLAKVPDEILQEGREICRDKGKTQMLGVLLGKSGSAPEGRRKKYDL